MPADIGGILAATMIRSSSFVALLVLVLGGCFVATTPAPAPTPAAGGSVDTRDHRSDPVAAAPGGAGSAPTGPIECHGAEDVVLDGCVIDAPDVAVDAHGNCNVVLTNCTIRAGRTAINAHGNADVEIRGGSVEAPVAVDAHGNANVVIDGAAVVGEIDRHGNADVDVR